MLRLTTIAIVIGLLCCNLAAAADPPNVDSLIEAAGGADQAAALQAIDDLGHLGAEAASAVPALTDALSAEDETLRSRAARALGGIGTAAAPAVDALTAALQDPAPVVRAYAAFALGRIGEPAEPAVDTLVESAFDSDVLVRRASLEALRRIDPPREKTRPMMVRILKEGDPSVIMPALQTFAEQQEEGVPRLREALQDEEICYWACIVASDIGADAAPAVPELAALLDHKDPDVRMHALIALGEIGEASATILPQIIDRLQNDTLESVRFAAAFALGKIGKKDPQAGMALTASAREGSPALLRTMSWWALARLYPERKGIVQNAAKIIGEGLTSENPHLRALAARALAEFDEARDVVRPVLLKALQDASPEVVGHAMDALAALGPEILTDIDDVLQHPDSRHYATLVIYRMGSQAAPAVPALVSALEAAGDTEDDNAFRREAHMALAAIGPPAVEAADVLIGALASDEKEVRGSACYALGKIGPAAEKAAPALQARMAELEDSDKTAFVWALLQIKPDDQPTAVQAVPLLTGALDNPDDLVRLEAANALGEIGQPAAKPEVIEKLKTLLDDPSPDVQEVAAEALEKLQ